MATDSTSDYGFSISVQDGVPVVTAPAEIDLHNARALGEALVQASIDHPTAIVDMTGNAFCDSSGLSMLIAGFKQAKAAGGELRLVMPQPHVRRVFNATGVDRLVRTFGILAEAAAAGPPPAAEASPEPA